ncbi:hypothetical protein JCM10296v2_000945 [Rhodotorula toruloides]
MPAARRASRASAVSYAEASSDEEDGGRETLTVRAKAGTAKGGQRARDAADDEENEDEGDGESKVDDGANESSDGDDAEWNAKPKRRKSTARGKKGRKPSGPDLLTKLPIDALTEIASFLPQGTLVELRRVCKAFHRLLTDKTSGRRQYYMLEKDQHCVRCGNVQFIPDRFLLRRLCRQCRKKHLVRLTFLKRLHPDLHPLVKDCLIPSFYKPDRLTYESSARHAFDEDIPALDQHLYASKKVRKGNPGKPVEGSRMDKFVKERQESKKLVEQDARMLEEKFGKFIKSNSD